MKKAVIIGLSLLLVLSLAACGNSDADRSDNTKDGVIGDGLGEDMRDLGDDMRDIGDDLFDGGASNDRNGTSDYNGATGGQGTGTSGHTGNSGNTGNTGGMGTANPGGETPNYDRGVKNDLIR